MRGKLLASKGSIERYLPYALFLALVCIFLWRPIFTGQALLPGDYLAQMHPWNTVVESATPTPQWNPLQWDAIAQFYPWRVFYARSMGQATIPLWNPHQFCGTPFLANGQSAVLYPPNLVFLLFGPITGFTVYAALHLFAALCFMYLLLRELGARMLGGVFGAVVFAFSAFTVLWLELPTFIGVAVWLPLVLLLINRAVERRSVFYGMLAGGALALAFLAGHFQIALYLVLAAMLWWLWKFVQIIRAEGQIYAFLKVVLPFVAFCLIAGLISAPQVLPSIELAQNSHRLRAVTPEGYAGFISNAVKPYRLITLLVPDFFGSPSKGNYFIGSAADYIEYGLYAGILPLMLALVALFRIRTRRYTGFFALLTLLSALMAFGTPVNLPFYFAVPGFSAFGGPNRVLLLFFFGVAGLAALGLDQFGEHAEEKIRKWGRELSKGTLITLGALLFMVVLLLVINWVAARFVTSISGQYYAGALGPLGRTFAILLLVSTALLLARSSGTISREMFGWMAVALIVVDLFAFGINYNPTSDRSNIYPETELTDYLKQTVGERRIAPINPVWSLYKNPGALLPPNAAMVYGLYDVQGYDSLYTRLYKDLSSRVQGIDSSPPENGNMVLVKGFDPDVSELAQYVLSSRDIASTRLRMLDEVGGVGVYKLAEPYGDGSAYKSKGDVSPLAAAYRIFGDEVIGDPVPVKVDFQGANRITVKNRSEGSTDVVVKVPFYPGWTAQSGGKRLEMNSKSQYLSARVSGPGTVTFKFEPFSFRFGLFLMMIGMAMLSCVGVYHSLKKNSCRR